MKKILFTLICILLNLTNVNATEWQEELLEGENIETEYRYRFYREVENGKYIRIGDISNYQYEEKENIKYTNYSLYQNNCPSGEGYETEYATKYVYKKLLPVQYIKINNMSNYDLDISNIKITNEDDLVKYDYYTCNKCSNYLKTINPGGSLILKIEIPVNLNKLNLSLEFIDTEIERYYELVYASKSSYSAADLIALIIGNTNIVNYLYDESFNLYNNYTSTYTDYDIEVDELTKVISKQNVCKYREIMTYHYNIDREYYDDNYYKDISELIELTDEEREEYQKDLEDFKIFYRYIEEDNISDNINNTDNVEDNIINNTEEVIKLVKTGIYTTKKELNYNYLYIYILVLLLVSLFLIKYMKKMSFKNDNE